MNNSVSALFTMVLTLSITGCATQTIQQADKFAQAGIAFSNAFPPVLEDSFKQTVQVDSQILLEERASLSSLSKKERYQILKPHNDALMARADLLLKIKKQSEVLKAYFVALQSLAESDAPSNVGSQTSALVSEASKISTDIKSALADKILGGATLGEVIPKAGTYIVQGIQADALRAELKTNGPAIERDLATFEGVLKLLENVAMEENKTIQAKQLKDSINTPFIDNGDIPADWAKQRAELFWNTTQTPAISNAKKAVRLLRINFINLMEGRATGVGLTSLIQAITELATVFAPADQNPS